MIIPSVRQQTIYDTFDNKDLNILIEAVAGSGKTTVLMELLKKCDGPTLFLAFNKTIQVEISKRIENLNIEQAEAKTLHSLGLLALNGRFTYTLEKGKYYEIANKVVDQNPATKKLKYGEKFKLVYMLVTMNDVSRMYLTNDISEITTHMISMDKSVNNDPAIPKLWERFIKLRELSYTSKVIQIDFTDMIYVPVHFKLHIPVNVDYLMIDEAQDLNIVQHTLIDNIINQGNIKKWVSVGDRHQCQPKGTKVLMRDLSEKNIEDIRIDDEVISYHKGKCQFVGYGKNRNTKAMKVQNTHISRRVDNVFTITLRSGHKSSYTSNHKCYMQLSDEKIRDKYALYMLQKGDNFRLGIYPCYSKHKSNGFGPVLRARAEKAEHLWIIDVFDTKEEAYLQEQIISYEYRIPQLRFTDNNNSVCLNQERLDLFWSNFLNQKNDALKLLNKYNREIKYPLWSNTNTNQGGVGNCWKLSTKTMFKTQACNIIPSIMEMCVFNITNKDKKGRVVREMHEIKGYEVELKMGEFISLDIENNHNYVADGILTSNSIYGFSGAYSSSFDLFKEKGNVIELPLDICYRCPKLVVDEANKVYDVMEGFKKEDGVVEVITSPKLIKDDSMVVCRQIAPLFQLFFYLVTEGRGVQLKGEDILNRIVNFLSPMKFDKIEKIYNRMDTRKSILKASQNPFDKFEGGIIEENLESIIIMIDGGLISPNDTGDTLIKRLKEIFKKNKSGIVLCTIHKSKGLESDYVYILDECLIPSKYAKSPSQLIQEQNLKYVARTRAIKGMFYLNLKEQKKKK